jgi:hypothetical protein
MQSVQKVLTLFYFPIGPSLLNTFKKKLWKDYIQFMVPITWCPGTLDTRNMICLWVSMLPKQKQDWFLCCCQTAGWAKGKEEK